MVDDYLRQYGLIMIYRGIAIMIPATMLILSFALRLVGVRPHKPSPVKSSLYECGVTPIGRQYLQFNFRYYIFGLLFVAFDVVVVFLYPWATQFSTLGGFAFTTIAVFMSILLLGWVYAWRKGALEWE